MYHCSTQNEMGFFASPLTAAALFTAFLVLSRQWHKKSLNGVIYIKELPPADLFLGTPTKIPIRVSSTRILSYKSDQTLENSCLLGQTEKRRKVLFAQKGKLCT